MTAYRFGDLVLESEVALPSLPVASDHRPVCRVRRDPFPLSGTATAWDHHWRTLDGEVSLSCAKLAEGYRLGVPGLAEFDILEGGTEVVSRVDDPFPEATLEHLLIDQVLPRVLAFRGRIVLHAGCVASAEGAIAFLGESGAGKSTLCAAFARAGWALLGDDALVVAPAAGGRFEAFPTYPGLRLLAESRARLASVAASSPVAHTTAKRRIAWPVRDTVPCPLLALYLLETSRDGEDSPRFETVRGREAVLALVRSSFQLHLDEPERTGALLTRLAALVEAVPIRRLRYIRRFEALPGVVEEVSRITP